jgi:RHS repeat-associated protein
LGRQLTQTGPQGTITSTYDIGGRRTRITHPDAFYVDQDYLVTGELTKVRENGATSGVGVLATYAYDDLGQRTSVTYGNGTSQSYSFDAVSRLSALTPSSGTGLPTATFGYNAASEINSRSRSNAALEPSVTTGSRTETPNGLNQLTAIGSTSLSYDSTGNLTSDGTKTYGYSSENLLTSATGSVALSYDPAMRLYQVSSSGASTRRLQYDGADLVAEYDTSGNRTARYVHGPGADEAIVQYDSSGTRRFLHKDERGSVVALSDSSGTVTSTNSYDEYGIPGASNTGRFQYTAQAWVPELGVYYYKTRVYDPKLPRFLQPDPIGYGAGMNRYAYVRGNPINFVDPLGLGDVAPEPPIVITGIAPKPLRLLTDSEINALTSTLKFETINYNDLTRGETVGSTSASSLLVDSCHAGASDASIYPAAALPPAAAARGWKGETLGINPRPGGSAVQTDFPGTIAQAAGYFAFLSRAAGDLYLAEIPFTNIAISLPSGMTMRVGSDGDPRIEVPANTFSLNVRERIHIREVKQCPVKSAT